MAALDLDLVATLAGATHAEVAEQVQSLWDGYGDIVRVTLTGAAQRTMIVKWIRAGLGKDHHDPVGHARKARSYEVEAAFYERVGPRCDDDCRVARLVAHADQGDERLLLLEDLDAAGFGRRQRHPVGADLESCLAWLASFHSRFLGESIDGVWEVGTYWHLATRLRELDLVDDARVHRQAPLLDERLRSAHHQTLLHGDAKPANFCFSHQTKSVAAVDFQYTGRGPGVRDVAYLLHGEDAAAIRSALDFYFARLREKLSPPVDASSVEREWRALFPVAIADFERFLLGWRVSMRGR